MKCATNSLYKLFDEMGWMRLGEGFHPITKDRLADVHFTVCRNPYDRAVSIWSSTCLREGDRYGAVKQIKDNDGWHGNFGDFVDHCLLSDLKWSNNPWLFKNQSDWRAMMLLDLIVPIEHLKEGLEELMGPLPQLPKENTSPHRDWEQYMTPEIIEKLNKWAGEDFSVGYERL